MTEVLWIIYFSSIPSVMFNWSVLIGKCWLFSVHVCFEAGEIASCSCNLWESLKRPNIVCLFVCLKSTCWRSCCRVLSHVMWMFTFLFCALLCFVLFVLFCFMFCSVLCFVLICFVLFCFLFWFVLCFALFCFVFSNWAIPFQSYASLLWFKSQFRFKIH